jgi:hypothetical protein
MEPHRFRRMYARDIVSEQRIIDIVGRDRGPGQGGGPVAEGQQPFESSAVGMLGEELFRMLLVDV